MHILALVPGGIGDQLLFFPTLETLKQTYPQASIDVVTDPRGVDAYQICPWVRKAVSFDFDDRNSLADWSNLLGVIREQEYEVVLAVKGGQSVGLLLWLCGIPARIGYQEAGTWFLTQALPDNPKQYAAQRYHDLLKGLGLQGNCPLPQVQLSRKDLDWVEAQQTRLAIKDKGYLLVYPDSATCGYPAKNWKLILQNLQERQPDLALVIVAEAASSDLLAALKEAGVQYQTIATPDLGKRAALIAEANLLLCPEGDALQIGVAVQTFTIALLDGTKPEILLPTSDQFVGIQSTTGKIEDISPQQVLDTLLGSR
jgi:ADP-heptose:LPS heptosyltransferase